MDPIIAILRSLNPAKLPDIHVKASMNQIRIGRNPNCNIVLADLRCSSVHCVLDVLGQDPFLVEVQDKSLNGTFINENKIGRGCSQKATLGDHIIFLSQAFVGDEDFQGFELQAIKEYPIKRANTSLEQNPIKIQKLENIISNELILHEPYTLIPCGHNFCGGCLSQNPHTCPTCHKQFSESRQNLLLDKLKNAYLAKHPESTRPAFTLQQLSEKNVFKSNRILQNGTELPFQPPKAQAVLTIRRSARLNAAPEVIEGVCEICAVQCKGFKCKFQQEHLLCEGCKRKLNFKIALPDRCEFCKVETCRNCWQIFPKLHEITLWKLQTQQNANGQNQAHIWVYSDGGSREGTPVKKKIANNQRLQSKMETQGVKSVVQLKHTNKILVIQIFYQ